ncbi:hypothetical protein BOX15_Mlig017164g1 [Macrostomum lignano]|uniref:Secreted protein n=1 Tax=Macrostomum lignano TaxID=282301 RepID=A0A267DCX9_9PLAT|nr:hypothetical protein BOX15_Mlig017164g4 [Macrostomum lignano]PAA51361.1 hypothetical protein BOX15_Mlig017164g2 [Macrostomum lignano]PAA57674.1 hypothetical protein BOX15_Mlig017164g1 [Macrostomum lignano]
MSVSLLPLFLTVAVVAACLTTPTTAESAAGWPTADFVERRNDDTSSPSSSAPSSSEVDNAVRAEVAWCRRLVVAERVGGLKAAWELLTGTGAVSGRPLAKRRGKYIWRL